jgi:hypothetical protein
MPPLLKLKLYAHFSLSLFVKVDLAFPTPPLLEPPASSPRRKSPVFLRILSSMEYPSVLRNIVKQQLPVESMPKHDKRNPKRTHLQPFFKMLHP